MFKTQVARREQVKLMIGLSGVSGAGKSYGALLLAYGITGDWTKITVIDTEHGAAAYNASFGPWNRIEFLPETPDNDLAYHPHNWIKAIEKAEDDPNCEVLILDSISHEWQGKGGCLQLVAAYSKDSRGNTFAPWNIVTPLHDAFVDKLRTSRLHIIVTMRAKAEYELEKNEKGKTTPKKVGLAPVQREGIEYEFGVMFDLDLASNTAVSTKDRTGIFTQQPPFQITANTGKKLLAWAKDGIGPEIFNYDVHSERVRKYLANKHESFVCKEDENLFFELMKGKNMGIDFSKAKEAIYEVLSEIKNTKALELEQHNRDMANTLEIPE